MPDDIPDQDIILSLARALRSGVERYLPASNLTVSRDIARAELAKRLVQLSKEGVRDEETLAQAGLDHLRELTVRGGKQNP